MVEFLLVLILIAVLFGAEAVIGLIRFIVSAALTLFCVGAAAAICILIYVGANGNG